MKLRYALYALRVPKFEGAKGIPDAFKSLPNSFDRNAFLQAMEAGSAIEEPILIATADNAEEVQSIEATLVKHGVKCLYVDGGSSFKRFFDAMKEKADAAKAEKARRKAFLDGARETKKGEMELGRAEIPRQVYIVGAALLGMVALLILFVFLRSGSSDDAAPATARTASAGESAAERLGALGGVVDRAERGSDARRWLLAQAAPADPERPTIEPGQPVFRFVFAQVGSFARRQQQERPRAAAVPGTGPMARWMVSLRGLEAAAAEGWTWEGALGSEQLAGAWGDAPFVAASQIPGGPWSAGQVDALAGALARCGVPAGGDARPAGELPQRLVREIGARCGSVEGEASTCLDLLASLPCDHWLTTDAQVAAYRAWLVALTGAIERCYTEEGLPWGERQAGSADLFGRLLLRAFVQAPAGHADAIAALVASDEARDALARVSCDDLHPFLAAGAAESLARFIGDDPSVEQGLAVVLAAVAAAPQAPPPPSEDEAGAEEGGEGDDSAGVDEP